MSLWSEERVRTYFEDGGHDPELSAQPPSPPSPTPLPSAPPPPAPPPAPPPPQHRVGGSMYGMQLAECERLSTAVVVVRGLVKKRRDTRTAPPAAARVGAHPVFQQRV
eukprot:4989333-Prymnesium_polylepis.1